jgi:trehalose 6-phosphate phosphatase
MDRSRIMKLTSLVETDRSSLPAGFWLRIAAAPHRLLALDYGGTLAPLTTQGEDPRPHADLVSRLGRIADDERNTVAVVSGRPLEELRALLGPLPIRMIGEHGWQAGMPDGRVEEYPLPIERVEALRKAAVLATTNGYADRLDCARSSVRVRSWDLEATEANELERSCARLWADLAFESGLLMTRTTCGVELRAPSRSKGTALRDLLSQCEPGTLPVYVGDDEEAFRAVHSSGVGIRVGGRVWPTHATGFLESTSDVAAFLESWELFGGTVRALDASSARPQRSRPASSPFADGASSRA